MNKSDVHTEIDKIVAQINKNFIDDEMQFNLYLSQVAHDLIKGDIIDGRFGIFNIKVENDFPSDDLMFCTPTINETP
ncbi:hypothetical protein ACH3O9_11325 [Leeuwenhoekiella sp. A16]|uniref:hypothetical protein n=1 Tax=Leeuwenhoekiella sp. A16 TaxID=3141462 RepID=UPI003A7FF32F